jgi:hypothetical protein
VPVNGTGQSARHVRLNAAHVGRAENRNCRDIRAAVVLALRADRRWRTRESWPSAVSVIGSHVLGLHRGAECLLVRLRHDLERPRHRTADRRVGCGPSVRLKVLAHAPRPGSRRELRRRRIGHVRPYERSQRAPEQSLQQHRSSVRSLGEAGTVGARARSRRTDPRARRIGARPPTRSRDAASPPAPREPRDGSPTRWLRACNPGCSGAPTAIS